MITKSRYLDSDELGGANDEGALGDRYLDVVDRQGDQILALFNGGIILALAMTVMLLLLRARGGKSCCARRERAPKPGCAWRLRTRLGSTGWLR